VQVQYTFAELFPAYSINYGVSARVEISDYNCGFIFLHFNPFSFKCFDALLWVHKYSECDDLLMNGYCNSSSNTLC
ncbi:MAG: hypothetical protein PWK00_08695, partial [Coxiella burnetii]|nr:hypothetical protein [Coxiella burnetii]